MQSRARNLSPFAWLAGLSLVVSCASTPTPTSQPSADATRSFSYEEGVPGGVLVDTLELSARVTAVDRTERKATLLGPDGKSFTVKVGPEAVNFDQVEVGDRVDVTLTEELIVSLSDEAASESDVSAALVALAPKGARPAGLMAETVRVTGTVTAIDPEARTATLRFADGSTRSFSVRPDIDLAQRKVGERLVFQVTEMIAIDVRKP